MRHLCWICWLLWAGLPTLTAYPVSLSFLSDSHDQQPSWQWEQYWIRYTIGLLSFTVTAFTVIGCLCCQRHRRPKGFQEFKNGSTIGQESTYDHSVEGLELDVPRMLALNDRVQFEPLPVHRVLPGLKLSPTTKSVPLTHSVLSEEREQDLSEDPRDPSREWFEAQDLYVPREKLKYLREIGRGWFGKVVEGRADLEGSKGVPKHGGVVVRILTEEASNREKAWFLGEAIPYLKMRHQNVLALLGFCLETDPYLLLFESCPVGDLKGFLLSNRDPRSRHALVKENVPIRMALEIAAGLQHMHNHGFAHTDLSARNCLVASDLSAKLGDYGTSVEKYPEDYYIVADRALPIRWSAPESLECTDTTIETREITPHANIWSYGIFLWEIITWGDRPYNDMSDEQIIQILLSMKTDFLPNYVQVLQGYLQNFPPNMLQAIRMCLNLNACKRPSLDVIRQTLLSEQLDQEEFEQRWESLRTNTSKQHIRSASLQDLRGSIDSDYWTSIVDERAPSILQSSFRLGPDEPVKNISDVQSATILHESSSETEEESWRGQIERGVYTEKVRQKSKSVTDLMVLVHIDLDSDAECSLGTQASEKPVKKKLPATSSDSDLRRITLADEFDEALKKLRDSAQIDACTKTKLLDNSEWPKLLTLTTDHGEMPILRLSLDSKEGTFTDSIGSVFDTDTNNTHNEKHVLRLLSKDPNLPLLRYIPDDKSPLQEFKDTTDFRTNNTFLNKEDVNLSFSNNFSVNSFEENQSNVVDVILWNHALDSALEKKVPGFSDQAEFNEYIETSIIEKDSPLPALVVTAISAPEIPQPCKSDFTSNVDEDLSATEDLDVERKVLPNEDEEERKHLSTPDDEQSSDSGFRDKESCEEEEGVCQITALTTSNSVPETKPVPIEEEQLKVLLELDTILDAEYYSTPPESDRTLEVLPSLGASEKTVLCLREDSKMNFRGSTEVPEVEEAHCTEILDCDGISMGIDEVAIDDSDNDAKYQPIAEFEQQQDQNTVDTHSQNSLVEESLSVKTDSDIASPMHDSECQNTLSSAGGKNLNVQQDVEHWSQGEYENENEDEDSSTMSMRSDNSYVSFGMEEEFVTAIRNELREKLPRAQQSVVEPSEPHDEKTSTIANNVDNKVWDDDENEECSDQGSGGLDISIRYNVYGTPLSPILEERESTVTSESVMSNSRDTSIASKDSGPSEDVLLVDTRTNKIVMIEGLEEPGLTGDDRDTTNDDISEDENVECSSSPGRPLEDKLPMRVTSGGAPLPSPEEESKWQQLSPSFPLPLPLPVQDELMSTSFTMDQEWATDDDDEDGEEDEDNSSSSGEFVWKRYNEPHVEQIDIQTALNNEEVVETSAELEDYTEAEDDEEEEEFTPSAWNATLAPHRSALRSPDKAVKSADQKKSVWFKKQRYHCVYEYPKETLAPESQEQATTTWEPTSYTDWEEMMDEPRLDLYPLDYDDTANSGSEEFYVSSSNRPFQFQTSDTKYVSQFFPGANTSSVPAESQDETDNGQLPCHDNEVIPQEHEQSQQQLGELRHTRDRLKLNLSSNGTTTTLFSSMRPSQEEKSEEGVASVENHEPKLIESADQRVENQRNLLTAVDNTTLPEVPRDIQQNVNVRPSCTTDYQFDNREKVEPADKCTFAAHD